MMLKPHPDMLTGYNPYDAFLGGPEPVAEVPSDPYTGAYSVAQHREATANLECYETVLEVLS